MIHSATCQNSPLPNDLNHKIPKPVSEIVMKLLAKSSTERYQNADGLITDLQKAWNNYSTLVQFGMWQLASSSVPDL
jgi:serine/threonine protein kinase